jgi:glycerol dehydrogenase
MQADVIIGIGGGKGMDFARGVHHKTGAKVVLCPTNAASNAAATTLNVIYNEDGSHIVGAGVMDYHPNLVLVDTNIIIKAPVKMLVAGIGDCISAYYESYVSIQESANRYSTYVEYAWHSNEIAKKVFFEHGALAIKAAECGVINPSFESVVAQILHISGPMMATMSMNFSHILDEVLILF